MPQTQSERSKRYRARIRNKLADRPADSVIERLQGIDPAEFAKPGTPLHYALSVMLDPAADELRRDKMALGAMPYLHPRPSDERVGKKEQREATAETAAQGAFSPGEPPRLVVSNP